MFKVQWFQLCSYKGESRVAGESRKSCALGCGRALLWNALPVARRALGARWKDPTPEPDKKKKS